MDDFFHIMCHVDKAMRTKIEKSDFIELERLLPKVEGRQTEGKMELVNRNGSIFFVQLDSRSGKISGIRRWEQAFSIYVAIYSAANPDHSSEIWQYVHVINTAASSYQWENVSSYDFTFRQLMAFNPGRSWAKIYTQG